MNPFTRYMKDNNEPQPSQGSQQAPQQASTQQAPSSQPSRSSAPAQSSRSASTSQSSSSHSARTASSRPAASSSSSRATTGGRNILSSDVEIKGKVNFTNDLVVDGRIEGEVISDGSLTIGENARIKAEIKTRSVVVYGKVFGNITVTDRVELKKDAELVGDIKAATISIEAGAIFVGKSTVGTPSQVPATKEEKPNSSSASKTEAKLPAGAGKEMSKGSKNQNSSAKGPKLPAGASKEMSKGAKLPAGAGKEMSSKGSK